MNQSRSTSAPAQTYPGACDRDPIPDHVDHFMGPGHNDLTNRYIVHSEATTFTVRSIKEPGGNHGNNPI